MGGGEGLKRAISREKRQDRKSNRSKEKSKRGDRKSESNDRPIPKIPDRRETSDIPGLPSGDKS